MYFLFVLSVSCGLIYSNMPALITGITLLLSIALFIDGEILSSKRWVAYSMLILSAIIILTNNLSILDVLERSKPFTLTIMLIISITLISSLVNANGMLRLYHKFSGIFRTRKDSDVVMFSSAITSPFLNMATPVIYGEALKIRDEKNNFYVAMSIKHGMMIAMLIAPTFAPIALVIGSHPDINWVQTIIYSLPLSLITFLFFLKTNNDNLSISPNKDNVSRGSGVKWIVTYIFFLIISIALFDKSVIVSIILSALITVIIALLSDQINNSHGYYRLVEEKCRITIKKINNEALLFISSGVLLISITEITHGETLLHNIIIGLNEYVLIFFVLLVLPLFSLLKLHPIIGFTLIQPLVYLNNDLSELQKYILWVCYWVIALQISPISVINITTSNAFNISAKSLTNFTGNVKVYFLGFIYSLLISIYGVI